jgi:hypothetical protein
MEQLSNCSSFTQSNVGQKLVIMLDGSTSNKDYAQRNIQRSFQSKLITFIVNTFFFVDIKMGAIFKF